MVNGELEKVDEVWEKGIPQEEEFGVKVKLGWEGERDTLSDLRI
jgi:hypothetical protein